MATENSSVLLLQDYNKLLSIDECIEIVVNTLGISKDVVNIKNFKIETFTGDAFGFLGEYFRLTIEIIKSEHNETKKLHYFLKSLPINNESSRIMIQEHGMFNKEVLLYENLFPKMGGIDDKRKWRPKCFYTRYDLLVLEDLTIENYKLPPYRLSFKRQSIECVLKSIAQLHSDSFLYEEKYGELIGDKYNDILYETAFKKTNPWFMAGLTAIKYVAERHPTLEKYRNKVEDKFWIGIEPIFKDALNSTVYRNVFCHRDLWFSNMLFKYNNPKNIGNDGNPATEDGDNFEEPINCVLIDFQISRYCPPTIDVLTFIYLTTSRSDRQSHLMEYLQFYYDYLTKELNEFGLNVNKYLSWSTFMETCEYFRLLALVYNCVFYPITHLPKGTILQMKQNEQSRYNQFCNVNRNESILDFINKDKFYADVVLEVFNELLEKIC